MNKYCKDTPVIRYYNKLTCSANNSKRDYKVKEDG